MDKKSLTQQSLDGTEGSLISMAGCGRTHAECSRQPKGRCVECMIGGMHKCECGESFQST